MENIYQSENWLIQKNQKDEIIVSYFEDGHYCSEIVLKLQPSVKIIRHD